jgi:hypothetical protein
MSEETKDPQEVTEPQPQAAAPMGDPPDETVGDIMQKMGERGLKFVVIIGFALAYVAGIVYAEVHGLTMLQKGVAEDMRIFATMGMVAAGLCALLFPIALKVWAIEARHRITTLIFYAVDFAFLAFNAITDFDTQTGGTLAPWARDYVTYILPASPIVLAGMITILFLLDPETRDKINRLTLRAAMKEKMIKRVAEAAKGEHVTAAVNAAAAREVDAAMYEIFGARPADGYYITTREQIAQRRTFAQSFFGGLSTLARRALSSVMGTQSQPSDSSRPQDEPPQA